MLRTPLKPLLAIGIAMLGIIATSHPATAADTLKIMPLGDSITEGWMACLTEYYPSGNYPPGMEIGGYRGPLYTKLNAAGYNVQFVGSNDTFPGTLPAGQVHHEGHSGWMISAGMAGTEQRDGLTNHIDTWLGPNGADPDIILLMIGTNDIWSNNQLATAPDRLSGLISKISNKTTGLKPNAQLIVAQITPFNNDVQDTLTQAYNTGVANVVANHIASGENVSLVDMHAALTRANDLSDLVHPNASGYNKIADVWFQGIQTVVAPEPTGMMLLITGSVGLAAWAWSRQR